MQLQSSKVALDYLSRCQLQLTIAISCYIYRMLSVITYSEGEIYDVIDVHR